MYGLAKVQRKRKKHNRLPEPKVWNTNFKCFILILTIILFIECQFFMVCIRKGFIQTKKYPSWTPVHRIIENAETAPFKQYFATWRDIGMQHTRLIRAAAAYESSDSGMDEEIDANEIQKMKKSGGRALGFMPDNGEGDVKIWRIDDHGPISVGSDKFGILFGSKTYVMKYHYRNKKNDEGVIIYYWQV